MPKLLTLREPFIFKKRKGVGINLYTFPFSIKF